MSETTQPTVGNYHRGMGVMARLWEQEVANDMLTFWRSVHPDIERHIRPLQSRHRTWQQSGNVGSPNPDSLLWRARTVRPTKRPRPHAAETS
jgi:hypothetical protein